MQLILSSYFYSCPFFLNFSLLRDIHFKEKKNSTAVLFVGLFANPSYSVSSYYKIHFEDRKMMKHFLMGLYPDIELECEHFQQMINTSSLVIQMWQTSQLENYFTD
ncbi:hypothetical protein EGW08_016604 [Elysia chlorotica]|uniref:Uncharacterized protein n=1 Tax=Elysia chlorotica TaxID=188477 RepID=A0A3S1B5S7_ELYCH|nr:hypothetical protein EGW08_016604 [Elysia chlorotica]